MKWNVNSLSKLTELSEELKSHNPIQETMENAILKLNNKVEDYFRNVLNKNGITESEWLENGNCEVQGTLQRYFYKGKNIFNVSFPELALQPESTEGKYSVYYWEPEDVLHK